MGRLGNEPTCETEYQAKIERLELMSEGLFMNYKKNTKNNERKRTIMLYKKEMKKATNSNHPYPRYLSLAKDLLLSSTNQV